MMPIVFWASLEPWLKAMNAAEITWSRRKPRVSGPGVRAPERSVEEQDHQQRSRRRTPRIGELTSGTRTLPTIPSTRPPSAADRPPRAWRRRARR